MVAWLFSENFRAFHTIIPQAASRGEADNKSQIVVPFME